MVQFEEKYVAFIDILGFKDIVYSNDKYRIQDYITAMENWHGLLEHAKKIDKIEIEFNTISDSIVIYTKIDEDNLRFLIYLVASLQSHLLINKLYSRGAISKGDIYFNSDTSILVGKGLISAYQLEQTANFPIVIIDNKIIYDLSQNRDNFIFFYGKRNSKFIYKNQDYNLLKKSEEVAASTITEPNVFISYGITRIMNSINDVPYFNEIYEDMRTQIYTNPKVQGKYFWLAKHLSNSIEEVIKFTDFDNENIKSLHKEWISMKEKFDLL